MDSEDSRVWGNTLASDEAGGVWASKENCQENPCGCHAVCFRH